MEYYSLRLCGLTRQLPLVHISKKTRLANFTILGDVELVDKVAGAIAGKLKNLDFDYLTGPEVKVVPLLHEIARRLKHKRFIVCRKRVLPYMVDPIILKPLPYFPKHVQPLVINGPDALLLKKKKVVIIDDVISTGVTMRMMKKLMEKVGAQIVLFVTVIRQGKQFDQIENLFYLADIPVFTEKNNS